MAWFRERPERYNAEITLIRRRYPSARISFEHGSLVAMLKVQGRSTSYEVKLIYPDSFPYSPPMVYLVKPEIKHAPHRFSGGGLCVYSEIDGPQISGKVILDWAVQWIFSYETWLKTGHFPKKGLNVK